MKVQLKRFSIFLVLVFSTIIIEAQDISSKTNPIYTADSLKSGNYKDILTSFFQLAFNNLTGENKEISFVSNPFAVMLKNDPALAIDKNYKKYKPLRKLNFGFGLKLDSSYKFNGFSSGIKYSLIDKRDATTSKLLFLRLLSDSIGIERDSLQDGLDIYAEIAFPKAEIKESEDYKNSKLFSRKVNALFNTDSTFESLEPDFKKIIDSIITAKRLIKIQTAIKTSPKTSFKAINLKTFDSLKTTIKNDLLWTIGLSDTTYKDNFIFSNLILLTELSKGILPVKPGSNLELNLKATCNFLKDTLQSDRNLNRVIFCFEPGINWVFRNKANDKSIFELKIGGSYKHNFTSLYKDEKRDDLMMTGILRIRVYEDIWIPLDVKYDPKSGNVFGLFNVKANFTGLGKILKGTSK
jgi:hypothetical protein